MRTPANVFNDGESQCTYTTDAPSTQRAEPRPSSPAPLARVSCAQASAPAHSLAELRGRHAAALAAATLAAGGAERLGAAGLGEAAALRYLAAAAFDGARGGELLAAALAWHEAHAHLLPAAHALRADASGAVPIGLLPAPTARGEWVVVLAPFATDSTRWRARDQGWHLRSGLAHRALACALADALTARQQPAAAGADAAAAAALRAAAVANGGIARLAIVVDLDGMPATFTASADARPSEAAALLQLQARLLAETAHLHPAVVARVCAYRFPPSAAAALAAAAREAFGRRALELFTPCANVAQLCEVRARAARASWRAGARARGEGGRRAGGLSSARESGRERARARVEGSASQARVMCAVCLGVAVTPPACSVPPS
jgi:hypothetical protein